MKILKRAVQGLIGLLLAAGFATAVSKWMFPGENDELFFRSGIRLSVTGVGAGAALILLFAFAGGWIGIRKRQGKAHFPGTLLNGFGFGLLPGIGIWKAFEQLTAAGTGTLIPEEIPQIPWLSQDGQYLPCRIEMVLALAAFGAVVLWLALRKEDLPENGDLLAVSITLWGTIRLFTGTRHGTQALFPEPHWAVTAIAAAGMLICLLCWTGRTFRQQKNTGYAIACIPVFAASIAGVLLQDMQILLVNPLADSVLRIVCALLAMKAVICMGRVSR